MPVDREDTTLAEGERYVQEELPPGFWEEDPGPKPVDASRPGPEPSLDPTADEEVPAPEDAAFATLQQLFPGRVVTVESLAVEPLASEDDSTEPGSLEPAEASQSGEGVADDADGPLEP